MYATEPYLLIYCYMLACRIDVSAILLAFFFFFLKEQSSSLVFVHSLVFCTKTRITKLQFNLYDLLLYLQLLQ